MLDAGVAEADVFALRLGDDGDIGFGVDGDSDAGPVHGGAELGMGFDVDPDAVLLEGDLGVFGVDEAAALGLALDVVAVSGRGEELLVERALQRAGGDLDLGGVSSGWREQ